MNIQFWLEFTIVVCEQTNSMCFLPFFPFLFTSCWEICEYLMARSHCTGPGPGTGMGLKPRAMGYYILYRTVHTAQGQGQGMGTGKFSMGFLPIFQDLKYFPVVLCNGIQFHVSYFQVSNPVPVPVQYEHYAPVPIPVPVPFPCSVNVP